MAIKISRSKIRPNLNQKERLQLSYFLDIKRKAKSSRRIWIPKPGKTEKRPIGIPTISERAKETLMKMALEPEWELSKTLMVLDLCHDAVEAIFDVLKQKTAYVLDADISGCLENYGNGRYSDTQPKIEAGLEENTLKRMATITGVL